MFVSIKRKAFCPVLMCKGNVRVFHNFVRLDELSLWQIEKLFETLLLLSPSLALRPKSGAYLIHLNRGQTDGHFFSGAPRKQSPVAKKI